MNFFSGKKISEEKKTLLEICKSKENEINKLTELTQTLKSENTILKEQLSELSVVNDELSTKNDHINNLYDKLREKYKTLEDEKDVVSVNELTFMNDNLRKERDGLSVDKEKLLNELAVYKSMFGYIQEIVKDYGNAILEVKKFNPCKIEHGEYISELYDTGEDRNENAEYLQDLSDLYKTTEELDDLLSNTQTGEDVMKAPECENLTDNAQCEDSELVEIRKIRKITKSKFDALECIDKRTVYIIVQNEDEEETVCFDESTFAKIIKGYCDAKEDRLEEVTNPILDGPYSDIW